MDIQQVDFYNFSASIPPILLASDSPRGGELLHRNLQQEGFRVHLAPGYQDLEPIWQQCRPPLRQHLDGVVLLEVSKLQSVEAAVDLAMRLKRRDARQFVGYLADPILRTSGLAGDAIFPRSAHHLPQALHDYFRTEDSL